MAHAPRLDFAAYVARQRAERTVQGAGATAHEYTYAFDRQSRVAFENTKPVALAVEASIRIFKQLGQSQLLGQAVQVSERQLPRIHALATTASATLHIPPPRVFVVSNPTLNAATYGTNDDSFVVLHSGLVDQYSDAELLAVIGHECGHIHNSHVAYLTALHYLTTMAGVFLPWVLQPALVTLRAWSRRAEITCDRAGMLVCRDAVASERAIAKLALGSAKLYEEFNLDAFLEQNDEAGRGVGRFMELFATHPWLPKRVLAMRVFAESRLYHEHVGQPAGGLAMTEVDERVAGLLKGDA
jgi:Zn-dependent protease with chaperone function